MEQDRLERLRTLELAEDGEEPGNSKDSSIIDEEAHATPSPEVHEHHHHHHHGHGEHTHSH